MKLAYTDIKLVSDYSNDLFLISSRFTSSDALINKSERVYSFPKLECLHTIVPDSCRFGDLFACSTR